MKNKTTAIRNAAYLMCLVFALCGCATTLTPAQQTLWATNVYLAQYDLYLEQVINPALTEDAKAALKKDPALITGDLLNPDLSEEQLKVLKVKKEILVELKPLVVMAIQLQQKGELPPADVQKKLAELINRLVTMIQ